MMCKVTALVVLGAVFASAAEGDFRWDAQDQWDGTCLGTSQSPIDLTGAEVDADLTDLELNIESTSGATADSSGGSFVIKYPAGTATLKNTDEADNGSYTSTSAHFHWGAANDEGSEHTVDGESSALEVHLVFTNNDDGAEADKGLSVVAILFNVGEENAELASIFESDLSGEFSVDLNNLLPADRSRYTYRGSLTTPPCAEAVVWNVLSTTQTVSEEQLAKFRELTGAEGAVLETPNNRAIQETGERTIRKFNAVAADEEDVVAEEAATTKMITWDTEPAGFGISTLGFAAILLGAFTLLLLFTIVTLSKKAFSAHTALSTEDSGELGNPVSAV